MLITEMDEMEGITAYDHLRSTLSYADSMNDMQVFDNAIYKMASRKMRAQADELVDAIRSFLGAKEEMHDLSRMGANVAAARVKKNVRALFADTMAKAMEFDRVRSHINDGVELSENAQKTKGRQAPVRGRKGRKKKS
jgi:putative protein kinase ArgK-like GTPase of G3E family